MINFSSNWADISPSEWPANMSGLKLSLINANITEWINIAGCVTFVCFKSSLFPLNIIFEMLKPKISLAIWNNSFALLIL